MTSPTRALRVLLRTTAEAGIYFAAWLLFVGTLGSAELVLGGGATALALIAAHLVSSRLDARFSRDASAIVQLWRLPRLIASGTRDILTVLVKHLFTASKAGSLVREVRFAHTGTTSEDATLQALATAYTTISPNFIVIDVDMHAHVLLFHQLDPTPVPRMLIELGARP